MRALRQRVEALRLLVDSREEEGDVAGRCLGSNALVPVSTSSARENTGTAPGSGMCCKTGKCRHLQ